jgi:hypothetical protein
MSEAREERNKAIVLAAFETGPCYLNDGTSTTRSRH